MRPQLNPLILGPGAPWSLPGSSLDLQFTTGRAAVNRQTSSISSLLTTTRASTGYATTSTGSLVLFPTNTPRITDLGLLVEQAATNVVLWNRDLTNVAWTKSNITAALNQTGADGTANAATSLTATAGNGTCLQAITLASSARFQSVWVKRITGTGTINMTMDNGVTWTAITVTAAYAQLTIPTQTLANPTVGFRIVTSGDAIAVDLVGNETGTFATSPIATTTVAVTRAADNISVSSAVAASILNASNGTLLATISLVGLNPASPGVNQLIARVDDGTGNNLVQFIARYAGGNNARQFSAGGGSGDGDVTIGTVSAAATRYRLGLSWQTNALAGTVDSGAGATDNTVTAPVTLNRMLIGQDVPGSATLNGYIQEIAVVKSAMSIPQISSYTSRP